MTQRQKDIVILALQFTASNRGYLTFEAYCQDADVLETFLGVIPPETFPPLTREEIVDILNIMVE